MYDVVIAGGSISGLLCAREIASAGHSVLVLEKDHEIGTPEHCGGLISMAALDGLGIVPRSRTLNHAIESAVVSSPSGKEFTIDAARQRVVGISRRELDKQAAGQAQRRGARILAGVPFRGTAPGAARTGDGDVRCRLVVDARGVTSALARDRAGALQSAQYEVHADWIERGRVRVMFDNKKYPGFFAWVIPSSSGAGKVGAAGRGINPARALDSLLSSMGRHSVLRRIFAPVWVRGPAAGFVRDDMVTIGDAAGQAKPTTAGGIFSCGMGGIFAGRAISEFLRSGSRRDLLAYQREWDGKFRQEFDRQLAARGILERLENRTIDGLFDSITPEVTREISQNEDFDFHTGSIMRLLGVRGSIRAARAIIDGEVRRLGRRAAGKV